MEEKTNNKNTRSCPLQSGQEEILLDYISGALDAGRAAQFTGHMQSCAQCADWVTGQQAVWARLDELEAEPVSASFNRDLYARIAESEKEPWYGRWVARCRVWLQEEVTMRPAVPVALACAMLLGVGVAIQKPWLPGAGASLASAKHLNAEEVAQAERALEDLELLQQWQEENSEGKQQ